MNDINNITENQLPIPPTTTSEQDLTTASQRKVNLIWEYTQAAIALMVTISTMTAGAWMTFRGADAEHLPTILSVAFGTVIGFYFSRTNHAAIGGVGIKPSPPYEGR